jgi:hypothetical protein
MNDQTQNPTQDQTQVERPIDEWNNKFRTLMEEAQTLQLFAPDVLFILQRTSNEVQNQINSLLFTHQHLSTEE